MDKNGKNSSKKSNKMLDPTKSAEAINSILSRKHDSWCPNDRNSSKNTTMLTRTATNRIQKDIMDIQRDPIDDVFVIADDTNMAFVDVLIKGPTDTPYEGGFFWFAIGFTPNYPFEPPKVKFMTTGGNGPAHSHKIRFNPNMYSSGKVCLSILGTWEGPCWTSIMSLKSLIISIRSLMTENPITNEPGYKHVTVDSKAAMRYNRYITYCTLKFAAVKHVMNDNNLPSDLRENVIMTIQEDRPYYVRLCRKAKEKYPESKMHTLPSRSTELSTAKSSKNAKLAQTSTSIVKSEIKSGAVSPISGVGYQPKPFTHCFWSNMGANALPPIMDIKPEIFANTVKSTPQSTSSTLTSPRDVIKPGGDQKKKSATDYNPFEKSYATPKKPTKSLTKSTITATNSIFSKSSKRQMDVSQENMSKMSKVPFKKIKTFMNAKTASLMAKHEAKKAMLESSPFDHYASSMKPYDWDALLAEINSDAFKLKLNLM